jgi:hypothetical protein
MEKGKCALCHTDGPLDDSHFISKGVYRLLRHSDNGNDNPVLMSTKLSIQTSHQMRQRLLCRACEGRFGRIGEDYTIPLLCTPQKLPLLERLRLALPIYESRTMSVFSCPTIGFDGDRIAYFGLSILWRAGVREWQTFDRGKTVLEVGAKPMESMRRYLVGETGFPRDVSVIVTAATDYLAQSSCLLPTPFIFGSCPAFRLLVKGISFRFIFGDGNPSGPRMISVTGGGRDMIFVSDCSHESVPAFIHMMRTTAMKLAIPKSA